MTEQDYINAKELGIVLSLKDVLKNIIPEISGTINKKEFDQVMKLISKWEINLFKKIN